MVIFPVRFIQQPKGMMERGQDDDELEVWSDVRIYPWVVKHG
jgi:hypothetical protein